VKRSLSRIIPGSATYEGEGFLVHRPFPTHELPDLDPFLLLDEMGPMDVKPGEAKGAPDHPHRGFETVTYMLSGNFEHKDSHGHAGKIAPGDVQWMTAGSGVVHSEMPSADFQKTGGRLHGLQIWVNLPKADKMMTPRYQEIPAAKIPAAASADGKVNVHVIAGEALGVHAAIDTRIPIQYLHFHIAPGAAVVQLMPREFNAFAYVLGGVAILPTGKTVPEHNLILFAQDGDEVELKAAEGSAAPLDVLLLAGVPIREPIARWGPFVMNTKSEIAQAMDDYQSGRMGRIEH
jgi:redox-sensitive bicupin YhaK (pirin superfamily)